MPRTPRRVNRAVQHLLKRMRLDTTPEWIEIEPRDDAVTEECTENVTRVIAEHGGKTRLGWMIREEDIMIEAIFHAVWKNPDGRTVDVTPQDIPVDRIMFVPDPALQYEGHQIPNVRLKTSGMMAVDHLIRLNELTFAIQNAGDRADQHRIQITPTESKALQSPQNNSSGNKSDPDGVQVPVKRRGCLFRVTLTSKHTPRSRVNKANKG